VIVVFDSSCLIGIAKINQLDTLKRLFGEIHIPSAVYIMRLLKKEACGKK